MFRNIIACICGIIISFLLVSFAGFIIMNFKIYPFYEFATGSIDKFFELGPTIFQKINMYFFIVIFPIIVFITGLVTGLIAKRKEYLIGIISIMPLYIVFFLLSSFSIRSIFGLISFVLSVTLGIYIAKTLKRKTI